jgi:hypothetical protein
MADVDAKWPILPRFAVFGRKWDQTRPVRKRGSDISGINAI